MLTRFSLLFALALFWNGVASANSHPAVAQTAAAAHSTTVACGSSDTKDPP